SRMLALDPIRLDVRPLLAAGHEPLPHILQAADQVPLGGSFELTAPFEPMPLYRVMRRQGFTAHAASREAGTWVVTFANTGITPESLVSEVAARVPGTAPVLAAHHLDLCCGGGKSLAVVAAAHGLDLDALLAELQARAEG
ncbi:MAG TPA: DUF542 domain-containing protein, partial [Gemmatimonadales bacterium]|nr:DUF542 domain-containing protein [Gemmatimonadales bacterium]